MKKNVSRFLSLILVFAVLISAAGCNTKKPEDVVKRLETAFNNADIDMMVECYEPSVQKMYKGIMNVGGALLGGVDLASIVSGLGILASTFGSEYGYELPQIKINVNSKKFIDDDKVKLNVTQKYIYSGTAPDGAPSSTDKDMYLVKIDDEWYISLKTF